MRRVLPAVLATLALVMMTTSPASAHAALVGSDPEDGDVLAVAPRSITLDFNEPIGTMDVAVTAPGGEAVEVSDLEADDRSVSAALDATTEAGTFTIAYRVVSVDGHPISGTISFEAEASEPAEEPVAQEPSAAPTTPPASAPAVEQAAATPSRRGPLLWGLGAAVLAVALVAWPLLRRRRTP